MRPSTTRSPDSTLWQAIRRGHVGSLEVLQDRVRRVCPNVLRRWEASPEEVESVLEDVFLSVWTYAREQTEAPRSLDPFLYWRARGALQTLRRQDPERGGDLDLAIAMVSAESDGTPNAFSARELSDALAECREGLDPGDRDVWEGRYEKDMSPSEQAKHLGLERGRIAVLLHRARRSLEACLRKKGLL